MVILCYSKNRIEGWEFLGWNPYAKLSQCGAWGQQLSILVSLFLRWWRDIKPSCHLRAVIIQDDYLVFQLNFEINSRAETEKPQAQTRSNSWRVGFLRHKEVQEGCFWAFNIGVEEFGGRCCTYQKGPWALVASSKSDGEQHFKCIIMVKEFYSCNFQMETSRFLSQPLQRQVHALRCFSRRLKLVSECTASVQGPLKFLWEKGFWTGMLTEVRFC